MNLQYLLLLIAKLITVADPEGGARGAAPPPPAPRPHFRQTDGSGI